MQLLLIIKQENLQKAYFTNNGVWKLLEEMGYTHVEKYLLYINDLKIVTV